MFIVESNPTFTHTVKVKVPVNGGFSDESFKATFAVMPADEAGSYDLSTGVGTADFVRRAVVGMSDLVDMNNQPLTYNDEVRDLLLSQSYVRNALARTYIAAVSGRQSEN